MPRPRHHPGARRAPLPDLPPLRAPLHAVHLQAHARPPTPCRCSMSAIERMRAELEAVSGSAQAAHTLTRHTIHRYLWDSTELHNTGYRVRGEWGLPADDLPEQVPDELKAETMTVTLCLVAITRALGGPSCPEIGLPMAHAAEAVLYAARTAARRV